MKRNVRQLKVQIRVSNYNIDLNMQYGVDLFRGRVRINREAFEHRQKLNDFINA